MAGARGAKFFLGGISARTTRESIVEHFKSYGEIIDAVAIRGSDGKPRCFGFVTFADPCVSDAVLADPHRLDGHPVEVKPAVPQDGGSHAPRLPPLPSSAPGHHQAAESFADAEEIFDHGDEGGAWEADVPQDGNEAEFDGQGDFLKQEFGEDVYPEDTEFLLEGEGAFEATPFRTEEAVEDSGEVVDGAPVKLFLGGLSPRTTSESIAEHFCTYGVLLDAVAMREKDGRPRNFGFITYQDPRVADAVLAGRHVLDGHAIEVKAAAPPGEAPPPKERRPTGPRTDKVFIGGLGEATQEDLVEYFSRYGAIIDAVVMRSRETGKSRGFGFVQYDNFDSVERVMRDFERHRILGKWVEVKRSIPRDQCPPGAPGGGKGGVNRRLSGGGPPAPYGSGYWPPLPSASSGSRGYRARGGYPNGGYASRDYGPLRDYGPPREHGPPRDHYGARTAYYGPPPPGYGARLQVPVRSGHGDSHGPPSRFTARNMPTRGCGGKGRNAMVGYRSSPY
mmetsp:Transcript_116752/g.325325  ORF Transcript_116752/g.325325 Transcript_116752/m.325325 type:complete len:506 (-) Transcript_116752:114-1631(-)